jgi:hypothetical protein
MLGIRAWTRDITFRKPVLFTAVGQPMPAGTYSFDFEEREIVLHGYSKRRITRCSVSLPKSMGPKNMVAMKVNIDPQELQARQAEDSKSP